MKFAKAMLMILCLGAAASAFGAATTSSFDNFVYSYTITPETGEEIRSFHVYTGLNECDAGHYYDLTMPAGWTFGTVPMEDKCVLTFWTTGDPLPAGVTADFGFTHYCAPCCHSWFVSDEGSDNPEAAVVDDDENHTEPCNIPEAWADQCGGPGLLLAPIYPVAVPENSHNWGTVKDIYR